MLKAVELVTVIHHTCENGQDAYTCYPVNGASWQWQNRVEVDNGLRFSRVLKCRIPKENAPDGLVVTPGDKVLRGAKETCTGAEFASLARHYEAATVLDARENFFGLCPHYFLQGE